MSQELFQAAKTNDIILVNQAFLKKPDIDALNDQGETALIIAVKNRSQKVIAFLLRAGASVNLRDHLSRTALHWGVIVKDKEIIKLLLDYNALTEVTDIHKKLPIILAKESGDKEIENIFEEFEVANYHADRLALRRDIESLVEGEDVVSEVYLQLKSKIKLVQDTVLKQKLIDISQQLYQPEELFNYLRVFSSPTLQSKPSKDKRSSKQNLGFGERVTKLNRETTKADLVAIEDYLSLDLTKDSPIFRRINTLIELITELCEELQASKNSLYVNIYSLFEQLKKFYLTYIDETCRYKDEMRQELLIGRIRVKGFLGSRYMRSGAALRFKSSFQEAQTSSTDASSKTTLQNRDNEHGLHQVLHLLGTFYKIRPSAPGIEYMVDSLNKIISGQGSAPTELIILEKGSQLFPVLASKAVYGEDFLNLLMEHPEYIKLIDSFNYSTHVIMALATRLSDAKFDNFIAILEEDSQSGKVIRIKLVGIDNDLALKDLILTFPNKSKSTGKHYVHMKSCFLLLPQMNQPVDPLFVQLLLKQTPEFIILKWLKMSLLQEEAYSTYKNLSAVGSDFENTLRQTLSALLEKEFKNIQLPIKLLPDTILGVYRTLQIIQKALKQNPLMTHHELVHEVEPLIARYYQHIREAKPKMTNVPPIIAAQAYLYESPLLEDIFPQAALNLNQYTRVDSDLDKNSTETLTVASENFINTIDYGKLESVYLEDELINKVTLGFSFLEHLTIRNCKALTDHGLELIAQNFKNLKSLTLINCPNVKGTGLSAMQCYRAEINLHLENMAQLSVTCWLNLLQHHATVTLVSAGKAYPLKSDNAILLPYVMGQEDYHNLVIALLMRGAHLTQGKECSPLHLAAKAGLSTVIRELIRFGASLDSTNQEGKTALDLACESYTKEKNIYKQHKHQQTVIILISAEALLCKNPSHALTILLRSLTPDKYSSYFSLCVSIFNFAHCHNLLNAEFIPKLVPDDSKSLDLSVPHHRRLGQHHVSLDVIKALKSRLPGLEHLDITGCAGLTIDILKEILSWGLDSLSMSYQQAEQCKLLELSKLNEAANLKLAESLLNCGHLTPSEFKKVLKHTTIRITHLNLSGRKLTPTVLNELQALLYRAEYLNYLELCNCGITLESLMLICSGFSYNKSLQFLLLSGNPLKEEGVNLLLTMIKQNKTTALKNLKELFLDKVGATSRAGFLIAEILQSHGTLELFSLYGNALEDEGIMAIADGIQKCLQSQKLGGKKSKLKHLNVNEVGMSDKGAIALARALIFQQEMVLLDVGYNHEVSNSGLHAFIELLELNTTIQSFKGDGLGSDKVMGADITLINQFKSLVKEREQGIQLARLETIAKANQIQWQRHIPEIYSKPEEDKAYNIQIESMSKRLRAQEDRIKQLEQQLLNNQESLSSSNASILVEEVSSQSVAEIPSEQSESQRHQALEDRIKRLAQIMADQKTLYVSSAPTLAEDSSSQSLLEVPSQHLMSSLNVAETPRINVSSTDSSSSFFHSRLFIKPGLLEINGRLQAQGYHFCYYRQSENSIRIAISHQPEKETEELSSFWDYFAKSIQHYDLSQKTENSDGILLTNLDTAQYKQIKILLKELGIIALDLTASRSVVKQTIKSSQI
jgi:hypothetical protein